MKEVRKLHQETANREELDQLTEVASSVVAVAVRLRELDRPFAVYLAEMLICELLEQLEDSKALALQRECKSKGIAIRTKP